MSKRAIEAQLGLQLERDDARNAKQDMEVRNHGHSHSPRYKAKFRLRRVEASSFSERPSHLKTKVSRGLDNLREWKIHQATVADRF